MNRINKITRLKTTSREVIEVSVSHSPTRRAYFLYLQPMEVGDGMVSLDPMMGIRGKIEDAARFNQNRLDTIAAGVMKTDLYFTMLAEILKQGYELVDAKTA